MAVTFTEWMRIVDTDYFAAYIPEGGFAVKFVIVEPGDRAMLSARLQSLAVKHGLLWAPIDAAETRLHMMHQVFFAVARQVDWLGIAQDFVEQQLAEHDYQWPDPGNPASFQAVAAANSTAEPVFAKIVRQWLTQKIWEDSLLAQDFRAAMMRLCLNRFEPTQDGPDPVIQWLHGDLPKISALKADDIFSRITRDNARTMLASLCRWLAKTGSPGIAVFADISQLALKGAEAGDGLKYTKASVMDAYEVLRQIIDDAEHYPRFAFFAAGTPDLIDGHEDRVIGQYQALQMRIWDDVRASGRDNPVAPLVRLSP
jgi:hypothetical protein